MQRAYDAWFGRVHGTRLIYNTCWEDPYIDRALLKLDARASIAMITSAGCNALDYLLDDPAEVHCIDVNAKQNALLELKCAAIAELSFQDLFALFGEGCHPRFAELYAEQLRRRLSADAQAYWDKHQHWFFGKGRPSFYFRGASGDVAWALRLALKLKPKLRAALSALFAAQSLEQQRALWEPLESRLFRPWFQSALNSPWLLSLLGVPRAQRDLITRECADGVAGFVRARLRHLMTQVPIKDNYFWHLYWFGRYSPDCCPNYLKPEHQETLRARIDRIHVHTMSLYQFMQTPRMLSHFVLLDHQDWLWTHDREALEAEWRAILRSSTPQARVLLRSASSHVAFLPGFAKAVLQLSDQAEHWHGQDRVGTYGCTVLGQLA
jgi:S-adenosylmethionine-diacylglycerol 3-amino-3-carboxypropyl transferase